MRAAAGAQAPPGRGVKICADLQPEIGVCRLAHFFASSRGGVCMSACEGKADVERCCEGSPLMTQSGHVTALPDRRALRKNPPPFRSASLEVICDSVPEPAWRHGSGDAHQ